MTKYASDEELYFEIYSTRRLPKLQRKWRWRAMAANNEIVATSGSQTYFNPEDALKTIDLLCNGRGKKVRAYLLQDGTQNVVRLSDIRGY